MFYTFVQNNSGGDFDIDLEVGLTKLIIIEANSHNEANRRAEEIGIYFDGVDSEIDCDCCGDRWDRVNEGEGKKTPSMYDGQSITKYIKTFHLSKDSISIHYKNGEIIFPGRLIKDN